MLAPRYIPTDLQTINFERGFKKHQRKLDEITKDDRKKKVLDKEGPVRAKLYETREKNLKFHNSEKLLAIEKDNEILLGRLVEISRKKGATGALSQSSNLPKTLNGPSRQREKDRIALENEAFAKRLLSQQARFDRKKLEVDYKKHIGLLKQMQRLDNPSTRKIKLPPLRKDQPTEEEKEDIAEEEERREKEEKEAKEKREREEHEKKEREEKEAKEKEEKERKDKEDKEEKEAQEKKEREEKEAKEKEERENKEKKEREEKEAKEKEEKERKEKEEKEAQEKKEREEKEAKEKEENEKKAKEAENANKEETAEDKKWNEIDKKDGDNPMLGMMRGIATK